MMYVCPLQNSPQIQKAASRRHPDIKAAFREKYGATNCEGLDELILTDNMSEDCSDYGGVSEEQWLARAATISHPDPLETLITSWRDAPVSQLITD